MKHLSKEGQRKLYNDLDLYEENEIEILDIKPRLSIKVKLK